MILDDRNLVNDGIDGQSSSIYALEFEPEPAEYGEVVVDEIEPADHGEVVLDGIEIMFKRFLRRSSFNNCDEVINNLITQIRSQGKKIKKLKTIVSKLSIRTI